MKKSRSILLILLSAVFALCVFAFTACTPGTDEGSGDAEVKITVAPANLSLTVGGAAGNLEATVENSTETVTWSSNKTNIATVTADATDGNKAVVTPVAAGEAVITAKIGDVSNICRVTVTGGSGGQQTVNITLDQTSLTLIAKGATGEINATVTGSTETVTWTVDKPAVASIVAAGNKVTVTPLTAGTAKVTAKIGDVTKEVQVTVNPAQKPAVTIALSETELNLTKGADAVEVTATLTNAEAGDTVQWSLADHGDEVVSITPDGNKVSVSPIGVGDTTLTAKLGDVTEDVAITVAKAPVSLTLDKEKVELEYDPDATDADTLTVTATVENAENKVEWKIGSTDIATIEESDDGTTCTVTAVYAGSTVLTASVDGKTVSIPVVITAADGVNIQVEITLSVDGEFIVLEKGKTLEISANVKGSAEMPKWSVDAEGVVELSSEEGYKIVITAVETGDVTLTVSVGEDEKSVELPIGVATLSVDKTEIVLINDENDTKYTAVITATVEPTEVGVSWEVADSDIIDIDADDSTKILTVTAKAVGTTTITAKIGDSITKEITVTVLEKLTVSLDESTLALEVDNTDTGEATLTATFTGIAPSDLVWVASEEGVVTLLDSGDGTCKVSAVAAGTVTITVTAIRGDEEVTAECVITVTEAEAPTVITEWKTVDDPIYGEVHDPDGDKLYHHVWFQDDNLTINGYDVTVKVNGEDGAVLDKIFNTNENNFHCKVRIKATRFDDVELKFVFKNGSTVVATGTYTRAGDREVVLDSTTLSIKKGDNDTVSITSVNGSADLSGKTISWVIDDTDIATIPTDSNGASVEVTAVAEGETTLTCTVDGIVTTCTIKVTKTDVVITVKDYSDRLKFDFKNTTEYKVFFEFEPVKTQDEYKDVITEIVPEKTTVEVTVNNGEPVEFGFHNNGKKWQDTGVYNLWLNVNGNGSFDFANNDYEFRFSLKNGKGEEIAYGVLKESAPAKLEVTSSISIQLVGDDNDEATAEVTAEISSTVKAEDIVWSISGDGTYATIPDDSKGISVIVTGKQATGDETITLTATYVTADNKTLTAECKVIVVNHDVVPAEKDTFIHMEITNDDIFMYHGAYYVQFILNNSKITNETDMTFKKFQENFNWSQTYTVDAEGNITDIGFGSAHKDIYTNSTISPESGFIWNAYLINAKPTNGTKYMIVGYDAQGGNKLVEIVFTYNNSELA